MKFDYTLVQKYSQRVPRYTSYPPVPEWNGQPTEFDWFKSIEEDAANSQNGLALYMHLPFCEKLCTYCGCNKRITVNHQVEAPYIKDLISEWKRYRHVLPDTPSIAELHLGGGTPTFFSASNLDRLISAILNNTSALPDTGWSIEVHPSFTTKEQLVTLYNLGFRRISLGVQSLDPKVQFLINRIQPFEEVQKITEMAREIGYESVNFDILYGLPHQTEDLVKKDIEEVLKLRPDRVAFYGYAHVPWVAKGQRRYSELDLPSPAVRFASAEMGRIQFENAGYRSIGMDHFALPEDNLSIAADRKELHRNFMGYTEQHADLMIGLGVSSISESSLGFAQNDKVVENYREKLYQGASLFVNGHRFSEQDRIVRKKILDIMCHMETPLDSALAKGTGNLLSQLVSDEIISIEGNRIVVNEKARMFLRSVCSLFDPNISFATSELKYSSNL
ncbi:oxygen-independent coproporphyrinogen III oxidase [Sanyastnella coralliicola]|uniref:oxygen-independent coproporphyrinogen III oxidase n=1 Tax=Sanyastnella coralliicola TaxID=3069118 RepID=UPI0027B9C46B|nr:oxygen-independent coproporphyrinogen III oxidase [Longitalea sp. SCSIO 12813]